MLNTQRKVFEEIVKRELGEYPNPKIRTNGMKYEPMVGRFWVDGKEVDVREAARDYIAYWYKRVLLFRRFIQEGYEPICNEEYRGASGYEMVCTGRQGVGPCPTSELCEYAKTVSDIMRKHVYSKFGRG